MGSADKHQLSAERGSWGRLQNPQSNRLPSLSGGGTPASFALDHRRSPAAPTAVTDRAGGCSFQHKENYTMLFFSARKVG